MSLRSPNSGGRAGHSGKPGPNASEENSVKHIYELSRQLSSMQRLADARLQEIIVLSKLVLELQAKNKQLVENARPPAAPKPAGRMFGLGDIGLFSSKSSGVSKRDIALIRKSGMFDEAWYLRQNADVAQSGMGALEHYLKFGEKEGRNPSPAFNVQAYVEKNPEVGEAGVSPLVHYVKNKPQA